MGMILCRPPWNCLRAFFGNSKQWRKREGATTADLIRRVIEAHVASRDGVAEDFGEVRLPLISAIETGPVEPISGKDFDELLSRDDFAA